MKRIHNLISLVCGHLRSILFQFIEGSPENHRDSGRAKAPNARLCVVVSLWLLLGPTLSLGSIRLAKAIPTQGQPSPIQTEKISVAVLSFQDESGTGASDEFCQRLGEHLTKKLYAVPNRTISPKSVRTKAGVEWGQERLSELGKKTGVQFVVHSGLVALSSDSAGGKITSRAQVYADILSVEAAVMKRVKAEGVGAQKGTDSDTSIQLGSADYSSREFHDTSVGQALSNAIEQLAASIYQVIGSGDVAPDQESGKPLPGEVRAGSSTNKNFKLKSTGGSGGRERPRRTGQLRGRVTEDRTRRPI